MKIIRQIYIMMMCKKRHLNCKSNINMYVNIRIRFEINIESSTRARVR